MGSVPKFSIPKTPLQNILPGPRLFTKIFGKKSSSSPPPASPVKPPAVPTTTALTEAEQPPDPAGTEVQKARAKARARAALAQGRDDTILTSGLGLTSPATTAPKTVLGT